MIAELNYWLFLLALVLAYWAAPASWRMWLLGAACIAYLLVHDPSTVLVMLAFTVAFFLLLDLPSETQRRVARVALILAVLFYLGYFKYFPVIGAGLSGSLTPPDVVIPLGISYFSFKLIHYAIERERGGLPGHGFQDLLAYVFLVPIFTAGPIERFDHFVSNRETTSFRTEFATEGLTRIAHGLVKRFVFGAALQVLLAHVTHDGGAAHLVHTIDHVSPFRVGAFLVLTYLYVYMDFSGYTDIAIGTSRLFGLRIMENFRLPILAPNIGNLWKRWHMTLAGWCQSYVYMPMIGWTRNPYIAVTSSFLVMGLWHAASLNFIAWGLYNAVGVMAFQTWLVIERKRKWKFMKRRPLSYLGTPLTFFFFAGSFAFSATEHLGLYAAFQLLARCFAITLPVPA